MPLRHPGQDIALRFTVLWMLRMREVTCTPWWLLAPRWRVERPQVGPPDDWV